MYTLILVFVSGKMFTWSAHWLHPMFSVCGRVFHTNKMMKNVPERQPLSWILYSESWGGLGKISFTALIDFLTFQIGNAWRGMRLPELYSIVAAAFSFSGRRESHLSHLSTQNRRWRTNNSIKSERYGRRWRRTVIRYTKTAFHAVISICCEMKAHFAAFDKKNTDTTYEKQPWKTSSRPSTWIIPL